METKGKYELWEHRANGVSKLAGTTNDRRVAINGAQALSADRAQYGGSEGCSCFFPAPIGEGVIYEVREKETPRKLEEVVIELEAVTILASQTGKMEEKAAEIHALQAEFEGVQERLVKLVGALVAGEIVCNARSKCRQALQRRQEELQAHLKKQEKQ
jgi:hypothetical protein